jgi:hypothetical protein
MTAAPTHRPASDPASRRWLRIGSVTLATALQLVVLVPFTVASGLVAPLWAIVGFYLLWGAAAAVLVVVARRRPTAALLVPIANLAVLWGGITLGEQLLGWTA